MCTHQPSIACRNCWAYAPLCMWTDNWLVHTNLWPGRQGQHLAAPCLRIPSPHARQQVRCRACHLESSTAAIWLQGCTLQPWTRHGRKFSFQHATWSPVAAESKAGTTSRASRQLAWSTNPLAAQNGPPWLAQQACAYAAQLHSSHTHAHSSHRQTVRRICKDTCRHLHAPCRLSSSMPRAAKCTCAADLQAGWSGLHKRHTSSRASQASSLVTQG